MAFRVIGCIKIDKNARLRVAVSKWKGKANISFRRQYKHSDYPVWLDSSGFNVPLESFRIFMVLLKKVEEYIEKKKHLKDVVWPEKMTF